MGRRALVTGIGGQDGSYLAELLLGHGYDVFGTVLGNPEEYETLGAVQEAPRVSRRSIWRMRRTFGRRFGTSSPTRSTTSPRPPSCRPRGTIRSGTSTAAVASISALLDGVRRERPEARFVNAASAEIFGAPAESPQTRADAGRAADALRRRQGLRALPHRLVPPSVRAPRLLGDPLQPRVAAAIDAVPDAER